MTLSGLPYYGGKGPFHPQGRWITSQLAEIRPAVYVEPFCGMLGIMLQRQQSPVEVASDANGHVMNFWMELQRRPERLERMIRRCPYSRVLYDRCLRELPHLRGMQSTYRAYTTFVALLFGFTGDFICSWNVVAGVGRNASADILLRKFWKLHERITDIEFRQCDALETLERYQGVRDALIYCDPPYHSAYTAPYEFGGERPTVNTATLTDALQSMRGLVAVSGYPGEWDHLGWRHVDLKTVSTANMSSVGGKKRERIERLWLNYSDYKPML